MNRTSMSRAWVIGVLAACGLLFYPGVYATAEEDVVATVNGHDITLPEFRRILLERRAAVFGYFQHRYGVDEGVREFWTSSFDGEVPLETLRNLTLDASVRIKVQQLLALEKGLVREVGYAAFLRGLDEENRRREKAARNNEVIYGPLEYSESTGFSHFFSLLVVRLKRLLAEDDFDITAEKLRNFYDATKQEFKQPFDDTLVRVLRKRYIDYAYEQLVAQQVSEAKVVVNEPVYSRILEIESE